MSTSSLHFQYLITGITGNSTRFQTRQNIKKPIANILYLESPPDDAVKLAYVGSSELNPLKNISISDRSDTVYENSRTGTLTEFIGYTHPVDVRNKNFLVTQVFAENSVAEPIPLYFKHVLSTNILPESVKIFDQNYNEISEDKYRLVLQATYDDDTGLPETNTYTAYYLYNNLENKYDSITAKYTVYFIQYTESVNGTEISYTELLNNEKAYNQALFEDYWYLTGELKPWLPIYNLSSDLILQLPTSDKYAVRYEETKRIKIEYPATLSNKKPWFPRVINGAFTHNYAGGSYSYSIPEFQNQAFNPLEPYRTAVRKECVKIDDHFVKLPDETLKFGLFYSSFDILIQDSDENVLYAITNNTNKIDTDYLDITGATVYDTNGNLIKWSDDLLLGVDRYTGIVHLDVKIKDSYSVYATYSYEELYYELSSLNMNPIFDTTAHTQIRPIYVVPKSLVNNNLSTQVASLRWLKVSPAGIILDTNQDSTGGNTDISTDVTLEDSNGYRLSGVVGLHYRHQATSTIRQSTEIRTNGEIKVNDTTSFPKIGWCRVLSYLDTETISDSVYRYFKYINKTTTKLILSDESSEVPEHSSAAIMTLNNSTIELVNFIDERTTLSTRSSGDELDYVPSGYTPISYSRYFLLGELAIIPSHGQHELTIIDIRENGGGIDEDKYEDAKLINPEVQWYADYNNFDGQPYPGNAVSVVKVPVSLKKTYSLEKIREAARQNIPFGVYPLIRFYGYKPRIHRILPFANYISVEWEKEGSEFVYDIWYTNTEDGIWIRHNSCRITDDPVRSKNLYILDGLTDNKKYIIKVTMKDKYYQWWYGYTAYNSIGGGLGLSEDPPSPGNDNNILNFQYRII